MDLGWLEKNWGWIDLGWKADCRRMEPQRDPKRAEGGRAEHAKKMHALQFLWKAIKLRMSRQIISSLSQTGDSFVLTFDFMVLSQNENNINGHLKVFGEGPVS